MPKNYELMLKELVDWLDNWPATGAVPEMAHMSSDLHPYTHLFSPIQVNKLRLKNRIVMGPMGNISAADEMGRPSQKMIDYFSERAEGGVGLITSGLVPVSQEVDPTVTEPGDRSLFPRIDGARTVFSGWRNIAEAVHAFGARFFIQLTPGLGRVGSPECLLKKYTLPVSSSWNPNFYMPSVPCRPLTDGECWKIIRACGQAAADARALLIDGVYLHGHEDYLLEQFANRAFNRRKIGRFADWQAFGLETVKEIRRRTAADYPLMYRIDLSLALNATYGERMRSVKPLKHFRNERTVEMTLEYMANLVKAGVDLFDVDLGCYDNWWLPHPPSSIPSGCYLQVSEIVKRYFEQEKVLSNAGLRVPVVGVGKLGYPDLAEQALRDGRCDMVMLARPLLADPDWANKAYAGKTLHIRPCIGDQDACLNVFMEGGHTQCSVNPRTGFEDVIEPDLQPVQKPLKVAVVGAGPAGVKCAVTAALRGHKVTLYDKNAWIGGMLLPAARPKIKYEIGNYLVYLNHLVERTAVSHTLTVMVNTQAAPAMLKNAGFDVIVVCCGGKFARPPIPGVDSPHVLIAAEVLMGTELTAPAYNIVVVGGGMIGCECAHFLAVEKGKQVTVVEMLPEIMKGVCTANRGHLIRMLEKAGVKLLNCARLVEIQPGTVVIERNVSRTVPDPYNTWSPLLPENIYNPLAPSRRSEIQSQEIQADLVVMASGMQPDQELYNACLELGSAPRIYQIGDAFEIKGVFEAVKAGYAVGRKI
jgi:2-enoate reductase